MLAAIATNRSHSVTSFNSSFTTTFEKTEFKSMLQIASSGTLYVILTKLTMDTFTITTVLTRKDYTSYLFREIYGKPLSIFETILGLGLLITSCLDLFQITNIYDDQSYLELGLGIFLLLIPTISVLIARKSYYSNPSLSYDISYTFGEDDIKVKGYTFESTLKWNHIIKVKEFDGFLLLLSSKKLASCIKTDKLTKAQLDFIKTKVGQK